jgi:hypothetical protein
MFAHPRSLCAPPLPARVRPPGSCVGLTAKSARARAETSYIMGNGASAGISAAATAASDSELKAVVAGLPAEAKAKLLAALGEAPAAGGGTQSAFVFVKPHANTTAVNDLVKAKVRPGSCPPPRRQLLRCHLSLRTDAGRTTTHPASLHRSESRS